MWTIWSGRTHGIWGSCSGKRCLWSLWQGLVGESPSRPLGFWSRAMSSLARNDTLFKIQLLICYQVRSSDSASSSWPHSQSCSLWAGFYQIHQVGRSDKACSSSSWDRCGTAGIGHRTKGRRQLHEQVAQTPCHPPPFAPVSLPLLTYGCLESSLYPAEGGKKAKICLWVGRLSTCEQAKNRLAALQASHRGVLERQWRRK